MTLKKHEHYQETPTAHKLNFTPQSTLKSKGFKVRKFKSLEMSLQTFLSNSKTEMPGRLV